jgi:hypothetical protein
VQQFTLKRISAITLLLPKAASTQESLIGRSDERIAGRKPRRNMGSEKKR